VPSSAIAAARTLVPPRSMPMTQRTLTDRIMGRRRILLGPAVTFRERRASNWPYTVLEHREGNV
jgi:hypothetical protein